jgi:uncharacterized protein (DUF1684 family)
MRTLLIAAVILLTSTPQAQMSDSQPRFLTVQTAPSHPDHVYLAALQQWRAQRAAALTAPDGWFSLVALEWLKPGETTVGSAPDNNVRLASAPAHLATLRLSGTSVELTATATGLTVDGKPAAANMPLSYDGEHPSEMRSGSLLAIVIKRGDRLYLRVKDAAAPTRTGFHGLNWYPPDMQYRFEAKWIPSGAATSLTIPNVLGQISHESSPGMAEFIFHGQTIRLFPILEDPHTLFFIFRDATSKTGSYGAGRFLYAALPSNGLGRPGTVLLDFNKAQNPPCAYTPFATCPLPPQQNRLTVPLAAGERRYNDPD